MAVLRELVARLSLDFDERPFDRADRRVGGLTKGLQAAGAAAGAVAGGRGFGLVKAINAADDANETLNLMGIVFQDGKQDVLDWADALASSAGRSEFALREMATHSTAILSSLTGDLGKSTEMAQRLSERAIDLASAFNVKADGSRSADKVALDAMTAALAGEIESLRRLFGVDTTDASLESFRKERRIGGKKVTAMSQGEKAEIRYRMIMERTARVQGDAANTADQYANAARALRAAISDLGVRIGLQFLPAARAFMVAAQGVVAHLGRWVERSKIVQAALLVFGGIATAVALRTGIAWAAANLPIVMAMAALLALTLIVDDFLVFLAGGESVIGKFIESMFGPGSAAEAATNLRLAWEGLTLWWTSELQPALSAMADMIGNGLTAAWDGFTGLLDGWIAANTFGEWIDNILEKIKFLRTAFSDMVNALPGLGQDEDRASQRGLGPGRTAIPRSQVVADERLTTINNQVSVALHGNSTPGAGRRIADEVQTALHRQHRHTMFALTRRAANRSTFDAINEDRLRADQ